MDPQEDTAVITNRTNLPTEEEVEDEACSGSGLFKYIRLARVEYAQFFLMASMFFIISFIYSFARILKDYFINEKQLPASISFIKIFLILPFSFLFVALIQKGLNTYSVSRILDVTIICFSLVFFSFGLFLFPYAENIQLDFFFVRDMFTDGKMALRGLDSFFAILLVFNEWTSSMFYMVAELWGSLVLSFLFLSFSNDLLTGRQSTRFIPLFYIGSNISLFLSGLLTDRIEGWTKNMPVAKVTRIYNIFFIIGSVLMLLIYGLKWYLEKKVLCNPVFIRTDFAKKKKKSKVGFVEGLKAMLQSKLLISISLIVLFYNISTNILESTVKSGVNVGAKTMPSMSKGGYSNMFFSKEQMFVAISVVLLLMSPFAAFVQTRGWIYVAIIPPIITLLSIFCVFTLAFYNYATVNADALLVGDKLKDRENYMFVENVLGVFFVGCMKIAKYACFDVAKEALSMKIDPTHRAKFKAIFDGLCGKLGKSIGAMYVLFVLWCLDCRDVRKAILISFPIIFVISVLWVSRSIYLNRKYSDAVKTNSNVDIDLFSGSKDFE